MGFFSGMFDKKNLLSTLSFGPVGGAAFRYGKKKLEEEPEDIFGQRSNLSGTQKKFIKPLQKQLKGVNEEGLQQLLELLNYEPEGLEEMQAPILEQWETQTVPSILERFSGSKASGGLNRSLAQGARGVTQDLSTLRAQLQQQALGVRQNALNSLLGYNQFAGNPNNQQNYFRPGQQNWVQQTAPQAFQAAGRAFMGG